MTEMNDLSLPRPPTFAPALSWTRFIVDYNPCFLLSAVCMLVGCRLLNDAIHARSGDLRGILLLTAIINVYECCLLGVAWLIKQRFGLRRDVGILLVVALFFLADVSFVLGDLATARPGIGALVAIFETALAAGLGAWALRIIDAPKRLRTTALLAGQIALLLIMPAVFKRIGTHYDGYLPIKAIYAGWWIVGLLPIVIYLVLTHRTLQRLPALGRLLIAVPYLALIGHLLACTWVFKLPFYIACYAPVLLGLALTVGMARRSLGRPVAARIEWGFAAIAVLCAINAPTALTISTVHYAWSSLTAFRLTLLVATLVNLHGLLTLRHALFGITVIGLAAGALLGPTPQLMLENLRALFQMLYRFIVGLIPRDSGEWGLFAVGSSFVLLLIGAAFSLRRHPKPAEQWSESS